VSKFEWMELETISNEIAHAQSRLGAARATKNQGMVKLLEGEIDEAAQRRARILADITKALNVAPSGRRQPTHIPVEKVQPKRVEKKPQDGEKQVEVITPSSLPSPNPSLATDTTGDAIVWDKLTQADLERIKRGLATRRSEILARHGEELKALEAEQSEIDAIEKAIAAFAHKFKLSTSAEVVSP
jgi:hypothetical protein